MQYNTTHLKHQTMSRLTSKYCIKRNKAVHTLPNCQPIDILRCKQQRNLNYIKLHILYRNQRNYDETITKLSFGNTNSQCIIC